MATGKNIKWKTAIPGVATSSPIVWGNRVFVTTAVSQSGDKTFRTGLYGDVKPVEDLSVHDFKVYSLDKATGKILWERTAFTGAPKTKRHTKSSQASSTPATDGQHVVAVFGSAGLLMAWDFGGKQLWKVDLGALDSGWFFDPAFQWGHSSSPIIYRNSRDPAGRHAEGVLPRRLGSSAPARSCGRPPARMRSRPGARRRSRARPTGAT